MDAATTAAVKPHISASQIEGHERCPYRYKLRWLDGIKIAPGIAQAKGKSVHGGAELNFRQKIRTRRDLRRRDIIAASVALFDEVKSDGLTLDSEQQLIGFDKVVGAATDSVVRMAGFFADKVAPKYQPVLVEERQRLVLPGPYDLVGVIDWADEARWVNDLKTAGRRKKQRDVDTSVAFSVYALLFKGITGSLPAGVRHEIVIDDPKEATCKAQVLESTRGLEDLEVLIRRINAMVASVATGVFPPAPPGSWQCDPRYCGYWRICPYVVKRR
jgi:hypothetical protein